MGGPQWFAPGQWRYRKILKSTAKAPCKQKLQLRLFKQPAYRIGTKEVSAKPDFDFPAPEMEPDVRDDMPIADFTARRFLSSVLCLSPASKRISSAHEGHLREWGPVDWHNALLKTS